jgi:hypothetical protein
LNVNILHDLTPRHTAGQAAVARLADARSSVDCCSKVSALAAMMRLPSWLTAWRLVAMLFAAGAVGTWWWMHQPRVSVLYVANVTMIRSVRPLMYKHSAFEMP